MIFENKTEVERIGKVIGYIIMYFIFTTILYFILKILDKLPGTWDYFHIMAITITIALTGILIKRWLGQ